MDAIPTFLVSTSFCAKRGDELFGPARRHKSVCGLVENCGSTLGNLLEHDRALDDDHPAGAKEIEPIMAIGIAMGGARRGDHQPREANGFSTT
jgi:hypothetical protein